MSGKGHRLLELIEVLERLSAMAASQICPHPEELEPHTIDEAIEENLQAIIREFKRW